MQHIEGAFNLLLVTKNELIGVRDPHGFKPLHIGETETGGTVIVSETNALDAMGATHVREVEPGEVIVIDKSGNLTSHFPFELQQVEEKKCLMELGYLELAPSLELNYQGEYESIGEKRFRIGQTMGQLEREYNPDFEADLVVGVPETARDAADGYSEATGVPLRNVFFKNPNSNRTFIAEPKAYEEQSSDLKGEDLDDTRVLGVREKFSVQGFHVKDKRVVVVDDSIVRGTTTRELVKMLYEAGAKEVHLRITAPPYEWPCFQGIDTGDPNKLLAYLMDGDIDAMREHLNATSLAFIGIDKMIQAVSNTTAEELQKVLGKFCTACFDGDYPIRSGVTPALLKRIYGDNPMPISASRKVPLLISQAA